MTIADNTIARARDAYGVAVAAWRAEQARGGIVELDRTDPIDAANWAAGQRWKTTSAAGALAMGHFQKAKAELDAAAANLKAERGFSGCPTCPRNDGDVVQVPRRDPAPDPRLPPERDDEEQAWR